MTRASDNAMIPVAVEGDGDYFTNAENVRYRAVDTHGRDLWLEVGRLTGHGALSAFSLTELVPLGSGLLNIQASGPGGLAKLDTCNVTGLRIENACNNCHARCGNSSNCKNFQWP